MNVWLLETYLILWLHTCGLCWCELARDFLRCPTGPFEGMKIFYGKKKKKPGEGAYLDAEGWERGMRVWLEKTLYSYGGNCLWEIPQDWRHLMSSWKAPCERGGQLGTIQLRFLLLYYLSSLPCPKPGDPRNLIESREGWPLYILIITKGFSFATGLGQRREMFSLWKNFRISMITDCLVG